MPTSELEIDQIKRELMEEQDIKTIAQYVLTYLQLDPRDPITIDTIAITIAKTTDHIVRKITKLNEQAMRRLN